MDALQIKVGELGRKHSPTLHSIDLYSKSVFRTNQIIVLQQVL